MSKQIAVMGNPDFILGFNLAGVRNAYPVEGQEFAKTLEGVLAKPQDLGILVVPAEELDRLPPLLRKKATDSLEPVVVAMGGGAGAGDLREKVKRAIGIDLYKE